VFHTDVHALLTTCTRYVFADNSGTGDGTTPPDYQSGVARLARQRAARKQAAEAAAQQAAAEAAAQQSAPPDPQSPSHVPSANGSESHPPASRPLSGQDN